MLLYDVSSLFIHSFQSAFDHGELILDLVNLVFIPLTDLFGKSILNSETLSILDLRTLLLLIFLSLLLL